MKVLYIYMRVLNLFQRKNKREQRIKIKNKKKPTKSSIKWATKNICGTETKSTTVIRQRIGQCKTKIEIKGRKDMEREFKDLQPITRK